MSGSFLVVVRVLAVWGSGPVDSCHRAAPFRVVVGVFALMNITLNHATQMRIRHMTYSDDVDEGSGDVRTAKWHSWRSHDRSAWRNVGSGQVPSPESADCMTVDGVIEAVI